MDTLLSYGNMMLMQMGMINKPELTDVELEQINTLNSIREKLKPAAYVGAAITPFVATALIYKKMKGNNASVTPLKPVIPTPLNPPTPSPLPTPPSPAIPEITTKSDSSYGIGAAFAIALVLGTIYIMTRSKSKTSQHPENGSDKIKEADAKQKKKNQERAADTFDVTTHGKDAEGIAYTQKEFTVDGILFRTEIEKNGFRTTSWHGTVAPATTTDRITPSATAAATSATVTTATTTSSTTATAASATVTTTTSTESSPVSVIASATAAASEDDAETIYAYDYSDDPEGKLVNISQKDVYEKLKLSGAVRGSYSKALARHLFNDENCSSDLANGDRCCISIKNSDWMILVNGGSDHGGHNIIVKN